MDSASEAVPAAQEIAARPAAPLPSSLPRAPTLTSALAGFAADVALAVVIGFALMMLAGLVWGVAQAIYLAMQGWPEADITAALMAPSALVQILVTLFGMASTALLLYFWRRPASALERNASRQALARTGTWWRVVGIAMLTYAASSGATWLSHVWNAPMNPSNLGPIQQASANAPVFLMVFAVVLAPLYEELLFRRVLFGRLWQAGYPLLGIVLSGLVFALAHEVPGVSGNGPAATALLLAVYAFMGMAFAWLYRRTGTLWAPIAAHALNNALAMAALRLFGS